jgi:hypothetical protein
MSKQSFIHFNFFYLTRSIARVNDLVLAKIA